MDGSVVTDFKILCDKNIMLPIVNRNIIIYVKLFFNTSGYILLSDKCYCYLHKQINSPELKTPKHHTSNSHSFVIDDVMVESRFETKILVFVFSRQFREIAKQSYENIRK
jgi:hypothetical protein